MLQIDIVIPWVDCNDFEWQKDYLRYKKGGESEDGARFRDWNWMRYWFRSIETNAPWINKVYFVTNGQLPSWINLDCPKLVHIKHSDYIPEELLPTFNSATIELFFHKIPGLSEHFVLFNDDCFINAPISPEYYFKNGLPCDAPCEQAFSHPHLWRGNRWGIQITEFCNTSIINRYFNRKEVVRKNLWGWYGWYQPRTFVFNALAASSRSYFGIPWTPHFEKPMLKSVWEEVWEKEYDLLFNNCTRFRAPDNINNYLMRFWAIASNKFYPTDVFSTKKKVEFGYENVDPCSIILNDNYKSICLEDTPRVTEEMYSNLKKRIISVFEEKYPHRSMFEKD